MSCSTSRRTSRSPNFFRVTTKTEPWTSRSTSRSAFRPACLDWTCALWSLRGAYGNMDRERTLSFTPVEHPDARVRRVGFDLTDPYVEQCWSAVVGPSSVAVLRRLPALWVARVPAEIGAGELSRSLGLGAGTGEHGRLSSTLQRLVRFRLATPSASGDGLDIFRQVAPLTPRQLARLPGWTFDTHERLFGAHLEQIDRLARGGTALTSITTRMDRLQRGTGSVSPTAGPRDQALSR